MSWRRLFEHVPKSAKVQPILIKDMNEHFDIVYLTQDEKYFVSTDHERVYPVEDVFEWTMIDIPQDMRRRNKYVQDKTV